MHFDVLPTAGSLGFTAALFSGVRANCEFSKCLPHFLVGPRTSFETLGTVSLLLPQHFPFVALCRISATTAADSGDLLEQGQLAGITTEASLSITVLTGLGFSRFNQVRPYLSPRKPRGWKCRALKSMKHSLASVPLPPEASRLPLSGNPESISNGSV